MTLEEMKDEVYSLYDCEPTQAYFIVVEDRCKHLFPKAKEEDIEELINWACKNFSDPLLQMAMREDR